MDAFDEQLSSSDGGDPDGFTYHFLSMKGHEFFCEVDEEYMLDRFNLTGLSAEVTNFTMALEYLTDTFDATDMDEDSVTDVEASARHLYGLIHARYIATPRGLTKMVDKFQNADFGRCPRVLCTGQALLPVGSSDLYNVASVQLFCPKCEDVYAPKSSRHAKIDGAFFGTSFPHLLLSTNPGLIPSKTEDRYVPKIFGFRVHSAADIHRQQDALRRQLASKTPTP